MFGPLGVQELLLIFILVLIVFGPRKIPEIGRTLGVSRQAAGERFARKSGDASATV